MSVELNDRSNWVLFHTQNEARLLKHRVVNTAHILLGLLREGHGVAAAVLQDCGMSLPNLRDLVQQRFPTGSHVPRSRSLPWDSTVEQGIDFSREEAQKLKGPKVGTEHLLLGLLRLPQCDAVRILLEQGVALDGMKRRVLRYCNRDDNGEPLLEFHLAFPSPVAAELERLQAALKHETLEETVIELLRVHKAHHSA